MFVVGGAQPSSLCYRPVDGDFSRVHALDMGELYCSHHQDIKAARIFITMRCICFISIDDGQGVVPSRMIMSLFGFLIEVCVSILVLFPLITSCLKVTCDGDVDKPQTPQSILMVPFVLLMRTSFEQSNAVMQREPEGIL